MSDNTIPSFPDEMYTEQAAYLAEHTHVTGREAEAYLRMAHADDNTTQTTLSENMGINRGSFSDYLSNARDKLDDDNALINSLTTMLLTTDLGGEGGYNRQVIGAKMMPNGLILLTETQFYDAEEYHFPSKYKAHLIYREQEPDIDFNELPKNIIHYDKHSVFTVESSGKKHFIKSVVTYIDALSELDAYDVITAANLLEDAMNFTDHDGYASDIIQDASNVIMGAEGQH